MKTFAAGLGFLALMLLSAGGAQAQEQPFDLEWGGHVRLYGGVSLPETGSALGLVSEDWLYDALGELRLKGQMYYGDWLALEAHHETILSGGDTRQATFDLRRRYPFAGELSSTGPEDDDHRFFDLTMMVEEKEDYYLQQRLDRLNVSILPRSGPVRMLRLGRQAVTWGNGMLFNPMDLLNPFAPTDIIRDYKLGSDMAYAQVDTGGSGGLEMLVVPRRDPEEGGARWSRTSAGAKLRTYFRDVEWDLMAAKHYEDTVLGLGATGYLGGAAWRIGGTWTFLDDASRGRDGYLALAANLDYSWVWLGKNFYGFLEIYVNSLADDDYAEALMDSVYAERLERGEMFTLGPAYLAAGITLELHPLFNGYCNAIVNALDGSAVLQPRLVYNMADNLELTLGATLNCGSDGAEFGGVDIPGAGFDLDSPDSLSCWISWYF